MSTFAVAGTARAEHSGAQRMRFFFALGALCVLSLLIAPPLGAQSYQGAVRGRVVDSTGAAIPGANVALINQATAVTRATISNEVGLYTFTSVDPATYRIEAESPGFKKFEQPGVVVETQQFIDADVTMEVGEVTEVITVTEQVPVIESASASGGTVLDNQKLMDLPNSGRNPFMMSVLTPGVVPSGNPQFNRMQDQSGSSMITIAGGPVRGNNYYLDGVPITDAQNRAILIPTIEAVMDVKVQSNTYDAEMGRTGGGTFNTTLKSGTNVLHGTAFGLIREAELTANNFFNNRAGRERPDTPYRNYGGSLGGPIWLPGVYNGRNRSFFHIAAEGYDQKSAQVQTFSVPTAAERGGDFSNSFNANGSLRAIYDPLTTQLLDSGTITRQAFANNVIPGSRIDTVGGRVAQHWAPANVSGAAYGVNNFNSEEVISDRGRQMTFKADHEFHPRFRMSGSYLHYASREPGPPHGGFPGTDNGWLLDRKVDSTQVNAILTPDATTVVSLRWGFNRFPNYSTNVASVGGFSAADLGYPSDFLGAQQYVGFPDHNFSQFMGVGYADLNDTKFYSRNFLTSVSRFEGKHSLKFGFDFRRINQDFFAPGAAGAGTFTFDDDFSRRVPGVNDGTGSEVANLLMGFAKEGSIQITTPVLSYIDYYAGYLHDDIRVTPDLTLNLGLRIEYEKGLRERNNNFTVDFDRNAINPISNELMTVPGGLIFAGVQGAPVEQGDTGVRLGPRFGVAYKLNEKTVLRGGFGFFWSPLRVENSAEGVGAIGFTQSTTFVGSNDGGLTPANTISSPFPDGYIQPAGNSAGLLTGIGSTIGFADPTRRGGLVQQYSFDIQRELPGEISLTLGYIGSRSSRLNFGSIGSGYYNINALQPSYLSLGNALLDPAANPFYDRGGLGVISGENVAANQLLRPFPQFDQVRLYYGDTNSARYDSLVIRAQKRYSMGLNFLSSFTWAKSFNQSWSNSNVFADRTDAPQNPYDLEAERGLDLNIAPWRWTTTLTYELPFGKGRPVGTGALADILVGGWQVNFVSSFQSGFPMAIRQSNNLNSPLGYGMQRPTATGASPEVDASFGEKLDGWFNPGAFQSVPRFQFGNLSRTINYLGPGIANWDISLFKTFTVMERYQAQFRAEFINAFNTPQFGSPNTQFGQSSFGVVSQQRNFPRIVQLGLRFIW